LFNLYREDEDYHQFNKFEDQNPLEDKKDDDFVLGYDNLDELRKQSEVFGNYDLANTHIDTDANRDKQS
jgi:hypothetical protein